MPVKQKSSLNHVEMSPVETFFNVVGSKSEDKRLWQVVVERKSLLARLNHRQPSIHLYPIDRWFPKLEVFTHKKDMSHYKNPNSNWL